MVFPALKEIKPVIEPPLERVKVLVVTVDVLITSEKVALMEVSTATPVASLEGLLNMIVGGVVGIVVEVVVVFVVVVVVDVVVVGKIPSHPRRALTMISNCHLNVFISVTPGMY